MQTPIPHAIARVIQHLRNVLGSLLPGFRRGGCEVRDCFFEQRRVVAAAGFEEQLAGGCAIFISHG
jgi:hypothetical protein